MVAYRKKSKSNRTVSLADISPQDLNGSQGLSVSMQPDGSMLVDLDSLDTDEDEDTEYDVLGQTSGSGFYDNLIEQIDPDVALKLGQLVLANVQSAEDSRSDWMGTIEMGLELLGVKVQEKNEPFDGACSAQHPLLMESAVKFQSKASNELLPADGPVKTKVIGESTPEKELVANKVKCHMNYQITEEMTEFYPDSERLFLYTSIVGLGIKKIYYSSHLERPVSEFIPADQFIVSNNVSDLHRANDYTHVLFKTEQDFEADVAAGLYVRPINDMMAPSQPKLNEVQMKANRLSGFEVSLTNTGLGYTLYEQHIVAYIEGIDEYAGKEDYCLASPYIITVDSNSGAIVGVRRNWDETDKKRRKKVQFVPYQFVPGFGFYGFGYLHLLGNLQLSLTAALRSLIDAGQFANLQGGFKLKGVRILDDGQPIRPGQFKEIESTVQDINKAIMKLPFGEPSGTLFQIYQYMTAAGQKFADSTENVVADSVNYGPVGTTMALLDASTKMFGAIHKRLHNSLKQELRIIARINSETLEEDNAYNQNNDMLAISREDYLNVDIVPVSDPNISSQAHRMAKAQALLDIALKTPQQHDMREVLKHVYLNMDYPNIDKILPQPQSAQPLDPISDITAAGQGMPIDAFPGQDHQSHIAIKQAFLADPTTGGAPAMQKTALAIVANIQKHMVLMFQEQIQAQMAMAQQGQPGMGGQPMMGQAQQQQQPGDPSQQQQGQQMNLQAMTMAAQQVAQINQAKAQQATQQGQNTAKDQAAMLLAHAELMDTQTKAKKQQADQAFQSQQLALQNKGLDLEKFKISVKAQEQDKRMAHDIKKTVISKGIDVMAKGLDSDLHPPMKPNPPKTPKGK